MVVNGRQSDHGFHLILGAGPCHFAGMAEIVNLRRVKKRRARDAASQDAIAARMRHGLTKAERDADARASKARGARLDGAKLDGAKLDDSTGHGELPE